MSQIFHPAMNTLAKASIFGALFILAALAFLAYGVQTSSYLTHEGVIREQPVPFSHEHHVRGLGLDCRFCHTSVEDSPFAGLPATQVCMSCHSQIWTNAEILQPVRDSWRDNRPIAWTRVHSLPDFVYFNHSIHLAKGVGCTTCHGKIDRMPLTSQAASLQMEWCLNCHREPEQYLRPRDQVFSIDWRPPQDQLGLGRKLVEKYGVHKEQLTNCSVCHR
ncbi:MAG TPA: cytochrome c3 family protein [Tepidisphaeraceae bacterium]|jgi:hypothetical protein